MSEFGSEFGFGIFSLAQGGRTATPATETTGTPDGKTTGGGGAAPPAGGGIFWIMIPFLLLMIVMMSISGRKQQKKHKALMAGLQKYDKVQTAGGILGTIVELKDHELVLRTDEASNTRIRIVRSAVQTVIAKHGGKVEAKTESTEPNEDVLEAAKA